MHTHRIGKTTFHYNGDMSGEIHIVRDGVEVQVPAKDLVMFITSKAIDRVISQLEVFDTERVWKWLSK